MADLIELTIAPGYFWHEGEQHRSVKMNLAASPNFAHRLFTGTGILTSSGFTVSISSATALTSSSFVLYSRTAAAGTLGHLAQSQTSSSVTITSSSTSDSSTVRFLISV